MIVCSWFARRSLSLTMIIMIVLVMWHIVETIIVGNLPFLSMMATAMSQHSVIMNVGCLQHNHHNHHSHTTTVIPISSYHHTIIPSYQYNHTIIMNYSHTTQLTCNFSLSETTQQESPLGTTPRAEPLGVVGCHAPATQNLQCSCTRSWNCPLQSFNFWWNSYDFTKLWGGCHGDS